MIGFGARLKAARKAKGLSQEKIAKMICVHRTAYSKYERDKAEPPIEILIKLTDILEVSADSLLTPR